jgi:hypothetical protein
MTAVRVAHASVDDLGEGKGGEYIGRSKAVLVFITSNFFVSPNCMRELLWATLLKVPVIAVQEAPTRNGGPDRQEVDA